MKGVKKKKKIGLFVCHCGVNIASIVDVERVAKEMTDYSGWLRMGSYGENDDCLLFNDEPLAEFFEDEFDKKCITVRYFTSREKKTKDDIMFNFLQHVYGVVEAEYSDQYSEYTGYLWTDENLMIGGHDLLAELESKFNYIYEKDGLFYGKYEPEKLWLILDIKIEDEKND